GRAPARVRRRARRTAARSGPQRRAPNRCGPIRCGAALWTCYGCRLSGRGTGFGHADRSMGTPFLTSQLRTASGTPGLDRRAFMTLIGGAAVVASLLWPLAARAESQPKMLRVGYVGVQSPDAPFYKAFRQRMAELGYREGHNFSFEYIQTPDMEGYWPAYRELAARKVDIFLAVGGEVALRAAQAAAGSGPIAFLAVDFDPVAKGYVASLARPGG